MSAEPSTAESGSRMRRRLRYVLPPRGQEVRRLAALLTLAVGIPRLPLVHDILPFASQRFGPPELFGVLCTMVGLLLLVTAYGLRLTILGRLVAVLGFVTWVTLAASTTSATSFLIDAVVAASMLVETGTLRHE